MKSRLIVTGFVICLSSLFALYLAFINQMPNTGNAIQLRADDIKPAPSNEFNNIFWLLQISDIHISKYQDPSRVSDLQDFIETHIPIIKPSLVIATGDLVDAKTERGIGGEQHLEEWQHYKSVLDKTGITKKIPWLDLRGNHDCFNVLAPEHESNLFKEYSSVGLQHQLRSYKYTHQTEYGSYSFIGIDACPKPGLKRPFNFFGRLTDREIAELRLMARDTVKDNFTIWFSHYPTATILDPYSTALKPALQSTNTLAYLCGHLHHMAGLTFNMYARQPEGHMELELADWKVHRRYRILAIDHDLFSFVDTTYKTWPVILVTNPKDVRAKSPTVEPLNRIRQSTHIRILIFSPDNIKQVSIKIDGHQLEDKPFHVSGPLYACKWNPLLYSEGIHKLWLEVVTETNTKMLTIPFSIDDHLSYYSIISNLILYSHFPWILRSLFFTLWFCFIVVYVFTFIFPVNIVYDSPLLLKYTHNLRKCPSVNIIWLSFNIYMLIGPWCLADVADGHNVILFLNGLQYPWGFTQSYYPYGIGLNQLATFNIPASILLYLESLGNQCNKKVALFRSCAKVLFFIYQPTNIYYFGQWFGWISASTNLIATWSIPFFYFLLLHLKNTVLAHHYQ